MLNELGKKLLRFPALLLVLCMCFRQILSYPKHTLLLKKPSRTEVAFYATHLSHSTTLASYNKHYSHFIGYVQMQLFCNTPDIRICHLSNKKKRDC